MRHSFEIRGVIVPLLTPMSQDGEQIDERALQAHVDWLIKKGVHGLMPCGTTGEAPLLAQAEREIITEIVVDAAAGRVSVIAHVGAITTRETVELAEHAAAVGVAAISAITPYYFALTDAALTEHFCRVATAAPDLPMYLYNLPARAGNHVTRSCAEAVLARCPNVVGIKDSSGDLATLSSFFGLKGGMFQVACGSDALLLRGLQAGALAGVSGNANVFPEVLTGLFEAIWPRPPGSRRHSTSSAPPSRMAAISRSTSTFWRRAACVVVLCDRPCRRPRRRKKRRQLPS